MVLVIDGVAPIRMTGDRNTWTYTHTFLNEGVFNAVLTIIGGQESDQDMVTITALPPDPEDSARLIMRAVKVSAMRPEEPAPTITADGDQV
jgi:hypothetical protein